MMSMATDRVILDHPHSIAVYVIVSPQLDFKDFRHVKVWKVAEQMGLNKRTVMNALDLLVNRGYLEEGPRQENNVRTFRLRWSASPVAA